VVCVELSRVKHKDEKLSWTASSYLASMRIYPAKQAMLVPYVLPSREAQRHGAAICLWQIAGIPRRSIPWLHYANIASFPNFD